MSDANWTADDQRESDENALLVAQLNVVRLAEAGWLDPTAAEALRTELSAQRTLRDQVEKALDEILGTEEEDGAGQGLVADVWLVAEQRDAARTELSTTREQLDREEALRGQAEAELRSADAQWIAERDAMLPVVEAAKAWVNGTGVHREDEYEALVAAVDALSTPPPGEDE